MTLEKVPSKNGVLQLLGVSPAISDVLYEKLYSELTVSRIDNKEFIYDYFEEGYQPADTILLGMDVKEPVRFAQRIFTYDKNIPIFILSSPSHCEQLKRTLMFSPLLSNEVAPWSTDDMDTLPNAIRSAIERRQTRMNYLNTISRAHIRLEKFPLLQPEATHYLDQLLDHAPIGVLTVDVTGIILTLNHQAIVILDTSENHALGRPVEEMFPKREWGNIKTLLQYSLDSFTRQDPKVFEVDSKAKGVSFLEVILTPLAYRTGQKGAMLIIQDVTNKVLAERERLRAEEDLRLHLKVLRSFHEISTNQELSLSEKIQQLLTLGSVQFGMPIAILSQINDQSFFIQHSVSSHPAFAADIAMRLDQTYCSSTILNSEPLAFECASKCQWRGHYSYQKYKLEAYIGVRVMVDGNLYGTLCFASAESRDTPFRLADLEILKLMSQWVGNELQRELTSAYMRKLSSALEQAADAVIITDHDRSIEYVNPSFEKLTGYSRDEVLGKKTYFLRSGAHEHTFYDELWQSISSGGVYRGILINRKKDGSIYHEQKTITPLKDDQGVITHFISTGHDISELVKAEEQDRIHKAEFAHVARLGVLGEMTSGLAHELNQPLCAITTYAQTCLRIIQSEDYKVEDVSYGLEQVVRQAELGGEIFRRLRNFARKEEKAQNPISLRDVIYEVSSFVRAECIQNQIQLIIEVSDQLPYVMADPIQIEQVLINLVRNSMDALLEIAAEGRRVVIKAGRFQRNFVRISVSDSGRGCPKEIADRLFEPFFTTKKSGLGIGLGISQTIVVAHGGRLWLDINSSNGTTFCFTLEQSKERNESN